MRYFQRKELNRLAGRIDQAVYGLFPNDWTDHQIKGFARKVADAAYNSDRADRPMAVASACAEFNNLPEGVEDAAVCFFLPEDYNDAERN